MWNPRTLHLGYFVNIWGFCFVFVFFELLENHWCERRTTRTKVKDTWRTVALALLHMKNLKPCGDWSRAVQSAWRLSVREHSCSPVVSLEIVNFIYCVFSASESKRWCYCSWGESWGRQPSPPSGERACRSLVHWTLPLHRVVLLFLFSLLSLLLDSRTSALGTSSSSISLLSLWLSFSSPSIVSSSCCVQVVVVGVIFSSVTHSGHFSQFAKLGLFKFNCDL